MKREERKKKAQRQNIMAAVLGGQNDPEVAHDHRKWHCSILLVGDMYLYTLCFKKRPTFGLL